MQQSKPLSSRRHPVAFYWLSSAIAFVAIAGNLSADDMTKKEEHLIEWRTPTEGKAEALRSKKTALYFFTAAWCGPCHKLKTESFNDPKVASLINQEFIPIMVMDREHEDGHNTEEVKELQKVCGVNGFPALFPVRWQLLDSDDDDLHSLNHPVKRILRRTFGYSFPQLSGYRPPDKVIQYLRSLKIWINLPPTKGIISWKPTASWNINDRTKARPQLLIMLDEFGNESDSLRMRLLCDEKWGAYINKYFDSYLIVSVKDDNFKEKPEITKIKKELQIKNLPALVVTTNEPREPQILTGFPGAPASVEFLERATRGKAPVPEEKDEDDDYNYNWYDYYD